MFPKDKLQHWRAFAAIYAPKSAPVLEFILRAVPLQFGGE